MSLRDLSSPPSRQGRNADAAGRAVLGGNVAGVISFAVACALARATGHSATAVLNAPSQWLWGPSARHHSGLSLRYTLPGVVIHQLSAMLWASVFESWHKDGQPGAMRKAAVIAAAAYVTDYHVVPPRLSPGCEVSVPRRAIPLGYAAFAVALACVALWRVARADAQ